MYRHKLHPFILRICSMTKQYFEPRCSVTSWSCVPSTYGSHILPACVCFMSKFPENMLGPVLEHSTKTYPCVIPPTRIVLVYHMSPSSWYRPATRNHGRLNCCPKGCQCPGHRSDDLLNLGLLRGTMVNTVTRCS